MYDRIVHAQADQAVMMMQSLPPSVLHMIDQGHWPGDGCFVLGSEITRPNASEVAQNYCFLKPLVMNNRKKAS